MVLLYLYLASMLLSAITGSVFYRYLKNTGLRILVPFLWYVFLQEFFTIIAHAVELLSKSGVIYNVYRPICTTVFVILYYRLPVNASWRKLLAGIHTVYLLITLITFLFIRPFLEYNSHLSQASSAVITLCGLFFLFSYFNLDNPAEEKKLQSYIWITIGITAFYPVVTISFLFYRSLLAYNASLFGVPIYQLVPRIMSIFMYSCFSYAFYLCKKKN